MTGIDLHLKQISLAPTEDTVRHPYSAQTVQQSKCTMTIILFP